MCIFRVKIDSIPIKGFVGSFVYGKFETLEEESMKKFLSAALALCLAFSLAACGGSGSSTPASTAPSGGTAGSGAAIKIGGIGPVTGSTAVYGNAVKNGAEIAIAEINALGGQQYEMKFEDDENDAEKAINAYNSLKLSLIHI